MRINTRTGITIGKAKKERRKLIHMERMKKREIKGT
jgi:hypothetical protein